MIYRSTLKGFEDENHVMKKLQKQDKSVRSHEITIN